MRSGKKSVSFIIKKLNVLNKKYKARDVTGDGKNETWCNYFVNDVAMQLGCEDFNGDPFPLLANAMVDFMDRDTHGWQELDPDEAQREANRGAFVLAGWKAHHTHHGHVCIVIPGKLTWSKQFGDDVPLCANVGTGNFYGRPVSYAFRQHMVPRYWMWLNAKEKLK
jgi:hypothetical protein